MRWCISGLQQLLSIGFIFWRFTAAQTQSWITDPGRGGGTATQTAAQVSHPQQNDKKADYFLTILGYAGPFWHRADHAMGLTRFVSCSTCPTQEKEGDGRGEGLGKKRTATMAVGTARDTRTGHETSLRLPEPLRSPAAKLWRLFPSCSQAAMSSSMGGGTPGRSGRTDRRTFPHGHSLTGPSPTAVSLTPYLHDELRLR